MSTYLNRTYGAANYARFRPTYPESLFNYIVAYHRQHSAPKESGSEAKPIDFAVDLACGPGQATSALCKFSAKVLGIDHASVMVEQANSTKPPGSNLSFVVGTDESLTSLVPAHSIDLLTVAQGAHWFKYPDFWRSAAEVLRPSGTLAIWNYWTFTFPDYPAVADIITDFAYGKDKCGPFWDAGREILDAGMVALNESIPRELFTNVEFNINRYDSQTPDQPFELVRHGVPIDAVASMLRTWSAFFNYERAHPDKPDLVDATMARILEATGLTPDDTVTVKWNTVYLLATRAPLE